MLHIYSAKSERTRDRPKDNILFALYFSRRIVYISRRNRILGTSVAYIKPIHQLHTLKYLSIIFRAIFSIHFSTFIFWWGLNKTETQLAANIHLTEQQIIEKKQDRR